jgi:hypothetical protein
MLPSRSTLIRTTITVNLDADVWHAYRVACLTRKTSASREITRFMRQELEAWSQTADTRKETVWDAK